MTDKKLEIVKVEFEDPGIHMPWRSLTQRFQILKPTKQETVVREGMIVSVSCKNYRIEVPFTKVREIVYAAPAEKPKEATS